MKSGTRRSRAVTQYAYSPLLAVRAFESGGRSVSIQTYRRAVAVAVPAADVAVDRPKSRDESFGDGAHEPVDVVDRGEQAGKIEEFPERHVAALQGIHEQRFLESSGDDVRGGARVVERRGERAGSVGVEVDQPDDPSLDEEGQLHFGLEPVLLVHLEVQRAQTTVRPVFDGLHASVPDRLGGDRVRAQAQNGTDGLGVGTVPILADEAAEDALLFQPVDIARDGARGREQAIGYRMEELVEIGPLVHRFAQVGDGRKDVVVEEPERCVRRSGAGCARARRGPCSGSGGGRRGSCGRGATPASLARRTVAGLTPRTAAACDTLRSSVVRVVLVTVARCFAREVSAADDENLGKSV